MASRTGFACVDCTKTYTSDYISYHRAQVTFLVQGKKRFCLPAEVLFSPLINLYHLKQGKEVRNTCGSSIPVKDWLQLSQCSWDAAPQLMAQAVVRVLEPVA